MIRRLKTSPAWYVSAMDTNTYIIFLLLAVAAVGINGQIIYQSGRRYLEHSYSDPAAGVSVARLISVVFHLSALGLILILTVVHVGGSPVEGVAIRMGVMLLVLAAAHASTMLVLNRMRERLQDERILTEQVAQRQENEATGQPPVVNPAQTPVVAPAVDPRHPYPPPGLG